MGRLILLIAVVSAIPCGVIWLIVTPHRWNSIIEILDCPVVVTKWDQDGLLLADGRKVMPPGLKRLPPSSLILDEATRSGVEIDSHGRIYGLVRIWHWCGNDSVGKHIARVDISRMLQWLQQGESESAADPEFVDYARKSRPVPFDIQHGWHLTDYGCFLNWCKEFEYLSAANSNR